MGNPLKRRTARMLREKIYDLKLRFDVVFGDYDPSDDTYSADVQRALENVLDKTEALIGSLTPEKVS